MSIIVHAVVTVHWEDSYGNPVGGMFGAYFIYRRACESVPLKLLPD